MCAHTHSLFVFPKSKKARFLYSTMSVRIWQETSLMTEENIKWVWVAHTYRNEQCTHNGFDWNKNGYAIFFYFFILIHFNIEINFIWYFLTVSSRLIVREQLREFLGRISQTFRIELNWNVFGVVHMNISSSFPFFTVNQWVAVLLEL